MLQSNIYQPKKKNPTSSFCHPPQLNKEFGFKQPQENIFTNLSGQLSQLNKQVVLKCYGNYEALQICTNYNCTRKIFFTCGVKKCKCHQLHEQCLKGNLQYIVKRTKMKINKTQELKQFIESTFDDVIDRMSKFRDEFLVQIQQKIKLTNLNKIQIKLLNSLELNLTAPALNSKQSAILWRIVGNKQDLGGDAYAYVYIKQIVQKVKHQSIHVIQEVINDVDTLIVNQEKSKERNLFELKVKYYPSEQLTQSQKNIIKTLETQSSICKDSQLSLDLLGFFPKKVEKAQLLYKASQHEFSLQKCFQLCGTIPNTMILCLTDKEKIVGGYTPFCHYTGQDGWVEDKQGQSFVFSLTNNDKFKLSDLNKAILRRSGKQYIQFGQSEILVSDNANQEDSNIVQQDSNIVQPNACYLNENYKPKDKSRIFLSVAINQKNVYSMSGKYGRLALLQHIHSTILKLYKISQCFTDNMDIFLIDTNSSIQLFNTLPLTLQRQVQLQIYFY